MSVSRKKTSFLSTSRLVFIFVTILIDKLGESIIFPILPFLVERFRSDALTLGLLTSSFAIAQFIAVPIIGGLSDRYGRRPMLLICVLGTAVSYFMFGLAGALSVLFISRIIDGATGGVAATAQAYIADISAPHERVKNFGLIGASVGLGFIIGPALGGTLANISINLPVLLAGTLALINFVLGYFVLRESLDRDRRRPFKLRDLNPINQLGDLLGNKRLRGFILTFFVFNFVFTGFISVLVLFFKDRFGWGPALSAVVFIFIGLVTTIVQGGLIGKLMPRFGEEKLTLAGFVLLAIAFGMMVLIPASGPLVYPGIYISQGTIALGVGLIIPCLRGSISNRVSDREQGKTLAGLQVIQSVAGILGPLWAGWTFDNLGIISPFSMAALLMLLAWGFTVANLRKISIRYRA